MTRLRGALTRREWLGLASMFGVIAALHLIGWITLLVPWKRPVPTWCTGCPG